MAVFSFNKKNDAELVPLLESTIGDIVLKGNIGICTIFVYGKEGYIPHFHIRNSKRTFATCVQIYDNKYFHHGEYNGVLSSINRKILNDWLMNIDDNGKTNWNSIAQAWTLNNPDCGFPEDLKCTAQPDYSKMK